MFFDNIEDEVDYYKSEYFSGFYPSKNYNLIVCVENGDDEPFWRFIINETSKNVVPAFLYLDGKENIKKFDSCFDNEFIGCVDSDYDYILEKEYLNNDYLFHTYVYSIENYCACAKTITSLLESLNIESNFDFIAFFSEMSKIIENILCYDMYLKDNNEESIRKVLKFNNLGDSEITEEFILSKIQSNIENLNIQIDEEVIKKYKIKITSDPIINENFLHLYMEGHIIFDSISSLLTSFLRKNFNLKLQEIKNNLEYTGEQKKMKINETKNQQLDLNTGFKTNYKECFYRKYCPSLEQIIKDMNSKL